MDMVAIAQKADFYAAVNAASEKYGVEIKKFNLKGKIKVNTFELGADDVDDEHIHAFVKAMALKMFPGTVAHKNEEGTVYIIKDADIGAYRSALESSAVPNKEDIVLEIEDEGFTFRYDKTNAMKIYEAFEHIVDLKSKEKDNIKEGKKVKQKIEAKMNAMKKAAKKKSKKKAKKKVETEAERLARKFEKLAEKKRS